MKRLITAILLGCLILAGCSREEEKALEEIGAALGNVMAEMESIETAASGEATVENTTDVETKEEDKEIPSVKESETAEPVEEETAEQTQEPEKTPEPTPEETPEKKPEETEFVPICEEEPFPALERVRDSVLAWQDDQPGIFIQKDNGPE